MSTLLPEELMMSSWKLVLTHDFNKVHLENIDKTLFDSSNATFFILLSIDTVINKYQEIKNYLNNEFVNALLETVGISLKTTDSKKQDSLKIVLGHLNPELINTWVDNFVIVLEDTLQDKVSIDQLQLWKLSLTDIMAVILGAKTNQKRRTLTQITQNVFDKKKGNNEAMKKPWDLVLLKKLGPESITLTNEDLKKMLDGSNRKNDPITIFHFKFYDLLFNKDPTLAAMFPEESTQRKAFTRMIDAMITKSNRLEENTYYIKKLGRRHIEEYQVERKHLEAFADCVLETFEIILGDDFGFTAKRAWKNGFSTIINMMIEGASEKEVRPRTESNIKASVDKVTQVEQRNMRRSWELVKNMNLDPKRLRYKTYDMKCQFEKLEKPSNLDYFLLKMYDNLFFETPSLRFYFDDHAAMHRMFDGLFDVILIKFEHSFDFSQYAKNLGKIHLEHYKIHIGVFSKIKDAMIKTLQEFLLDKLSVNLLKSWKTCIECIIQLMAEGQREVPLMEDDSFGNTNPGVFPMEKLETMRKSWIAIQNKNVQLTSFKLKCSESLLLVGQVKTELKPHTIFTVKYYDNLLWEYPELAAFYNTAEKQKQDFASLIFMLHEKLEYVEHYEEKIREQGRKNSEVLGLKPEFYDWQKKCLISTLKEFLTDEFDSSTSTAWKDANDQINLFLIEGPKIRKRSETNSMLSRTTKISIQQSLKVSPLQVKLITKSWERILVLKVDVKTVKLRHFPKDTLDYQKNPTTIFSYLYYDNLFMEDKEFVKFFPDIMSQSRAFGGLISYVVKKLDSIDEHEEKIRELGKQHEEWDVKPEMFAKLTNCLLKSIKELLGADFDVETEDAWSSALQILVELLIEGPVKKPRGRRLSENFDTRVSRKVTSTVDPKFLTIESSVNTLARKTADSEQSSKDSLYSQKKFGNGASRDFAP